MDNDMFGRTITMTADETQAAYIVTNADGSTAFSLMFSVDVPLDQIYNSINAMAPPGWQPSNDQ